MKIGMKGKGTGIAAALLALAALLLPAGFSAGQAPPRAGAAGEIHRNRDGYLAITVEQLAQMLPRKRFTLVNVHIPYEGEIPGTDRFIPFDRIAENLDRLPGKGEPIVLYCRSGSMSATAAKALAALGYTGVMELDGGFNAWKRAGYRLIDRR